MDKHPFGISGEFRAALSAVRKFGGRTALGLRDILDERATVLNPAYTQEIYTGPLQGGPGMAWTANNHLLTRDGANILEYSPTQNSSHLGTSIHGVQPPVTFPSPSSFLPIRYKPRLNPGGLSTSATINSRLPSPSRSATVIAPCWFSHENQSGIGIQGPQPPCTFPFAELQLFISTRLQNHQGPQIRMRLATPGC